MVGGSLVGMMRAFRLNVAAQGPRKRGEAKRTSAGKGAAATAGYASLLNNPLRIPCYFPQMPVWVLEVAGVATPKGVMR